MPRYVIAAARASVRQVEVEAESADDALLAARSMSDAQLEKFPEVDHTWQIDWHAERVDDEPLDAVAVLAQSTRLSRAEIVSALDEGNAG